MEYKSKKQLFYWQGLRLAGESEASHTENRRWYAYEENSYAPLALIDHWHEIDKDEVVYYHNELNGTPYALSNTQGELIRDTETYLWGSYRRPAKNQVTLLYGQPLRFQGQYFDQETGLHYNTFRYYDPETGRFPQQDPIGLAGGIKLYQYASNPLTWINRLGLSGEGVPHGFKSFGQFKQFGQALQAGMSRLGYTSAVSYMQGSSVSGVSFSTGEPFDDGRISDFDVAISHPDLYQRAEQLGIGKGGRTRPINMGSDMAKQLGIDDTLQRLSRMSGGRPVNAMIFESPAEVVKAKGNGIRIPTKCGG